MPVIILIIPSTKPPTSIITNPCYNSKEFILLTPLYLCGNKDWGEKKDLPNFFQIKT